MASTAATSTTCPLCHTLRPLVEKGDGSWTCPVCRQDWDPKRLQTVAAYVDFCNKRLATRAPFAAQTRRGDQEPWDDQGADDRGDRPNDEVPAIRREEGPFPDDPDEERERRDRRGS